MFEELLGRPVIDPTGRAYGVLDELFVGRSSGRPEFGIVRLDEEGTERVAVPLGGMRPGGRGIDLPLDLDRVLSAPRVRGEVDEIPSDAGRLIHEHFGTADAPTTELPATAPSPPVAPVGDEPDVAEVVLSEEQLAVETRARVAERVRVRKAVVTEEVTLTVTVRREELVIEREPLDPASAPQGSDLDFGGAGEVEFVLHAEEPVVTKRIVPVETVRLRRDTVTEERHVTETVRRERAEVEELPTTPTPEDPTP